MLLDVRPIANLHPRSLMDVRRITLKCLSEADLDALVNGREPLIVEGLNENWPSKYRNAPLREIAQFANDPASVHVDGQQRFGMRASFFAGTCSATSGKVS